MNKKMDKNWVIKSLGSSKLVDQLSEALNIDKILVNLLVQRNIKSYEDAKSFLGRRWKIFMILS